MLEESEKEAAEGFLKTISEQLQATIEEVCIDPFALIILTKASSTRLSA
jgi:hypothetical protein